MYKKLSDTQIQILIDAGINEFAQNGFAGANLTRIAKEAGVSVGVIYKYYEDKEALFLACVRYSLEALNQALKDVAVKSDDLYESIKSVVHTLIRHSKENPNINRMYNEITSGGAKQYAIVLAKEIEEISALVYTDLLTKAQENGHCREDVNPAVFAFFFDSLFMMLQFSYSCDYYRERLKLYCGEEIFGDDNLMEEELVKFLAGALGIR